MTHFARLMALLLLVGIAPTASTAPVVPDWAYPGSPTHVQVAPPLDFHRPSRNFDTPIGIFQGQSDVGAALVAGSAAFDARTKRYTIQSAGYNIWYTRDEFRFLWKRLSGDVSLAADITYPDPNGFHDHKAVLVIRQTLEDGSREVMVALHGDGMIHLAERAETNDTISDMEYRIGSRNGAHPAALVTVHARRIGIEKRGDSFALYISQNGEPIHQFGPPMSLHIEGPFYVGIGFCSHLPDQSETAVLANVVLENAAGNVR